jgi:hypothetical protein
LDDELKIRRREAFPTIRFNHRDWKTSSGCASAFSLCSNGAPTFRFRKCAAENQRPNAPP